MRSMIWEIIHELDRLDREAQQCEVLIGMRAHSHSNAIHEPCPKETLKALKLRLKELVVDDFKDMIDKEINYLRDCINDYD